MPNRSVNKKAISAAARKLGVAPSKTTVKQATALKDQYDVIKQDITKLRSDVAKGVEMAKSWLGNITHS